MKKLVLLLALVTMFVTSVYSQKKETIKDPPTQTVVLEQELKLVSAIPVGTKYYTADIEGFGVTFVDRKGQIEVLSDISSDYYIRESKSGHNPDVVILYDEELEMYRVAETLAEYKREKDGVNVFAVKKANIIPLKRQKIE